MCKTVIINRGDKEISTPREFEQYFGFLPKKAEIYSLEDNEQYAGVELDECLCSADLVKTLRENKIDFKTYWGDVYVGELDLVEEDMPRMY